MSGLAQDSLCGVTFGKAQDGLRGVVSPWTTCWALLFFKTIENNDGDPQKKHYHRCSLHTMVSEKLCRPGRLGGTGENYWAPVNSAV